MCVCIWLLLSVAAADTGQPPPVATIVISRNGQRVPYPPPLTDLPTGVTAWTEQRLPTAAAWNMSETDFAQQGLTGRGRTLMRHMGEYVAAAEAPASRCGDLVTQILLTDSTDHSRISAPDSAHFARDRSVGRPPPPWLA
jgi:hypothetical protein